MANSTSVDQSWGRIRNRHGLVCRPAILRLVQRVAQQFQPERIILFGSYAYGKPNRESDVDLLVVMPARNEIDQALRIEQTLDPPFSVDVVVRTPKNLHWRLEEGDWFLREVVKRGKVLYENNHGRMGSQGRSRSGHRAKDSDR